MRNILFNEEVEKKILNGVTAISSAVKMTMGAKGRNVMIEKGNFQHPIITKDGVTVAQNVSLSDKEEDMICSLVRKVAWETNVSAGDGTTTSVVLAESLIKNGLNVIKKEYANPFDIQKGMNIAKDYFISELKNNAIKKNRKFIVKNIANVSSNGDKDIERLAIEAFNKVGDNGIVMPSISDSKESYIEFIDGMIYKSGTTTPALLDNGIQILNDCYIYVIDERLEDIQQVSWAILTAKEHNGNLLIICAGIDHSVAPKIALEAYNHNVQVGIIKSILYGEEKMDLLKDILVYTNAEVLYDTNSFKKSTLGYCKQVQVYNTYTVFKEGNYNKDTLKNHIKSLSKRKNKGDFLKRNAIKERIALLKKGMSVIYIGSSTEIEAKERFDRVEDTINAVHSAISEGVVIGGGKALLNISKNNNKEEYFAKNNINPKYMGGFKIVEEALKYPFYTIIENAGLNIEEIEVELENKEPNIGYNVYTEQYEDFSQSGIIDPIKTLRVALENSISIAGTLLTTNCIISESYDKD